MRRLALLAIFLALPAMAADRHVFLDTDGDTFLNQCPNPAHNTFASPSSGNLQYCNGGANDKKILGDKTGYVSSCPGGGAAGVTSGMSVDILGNGVNKSVYGHPQACVWNMAKSDSCEVHAGTYRKAGAQADEDATAAVPDQCDRSDCWFATVYAAGYFADGHTDGYGTAGSPGWLRGAQMNGSTDTWDSNNNKIPDADESVTSYPAIFSGDRNNDGAFQATACSGNVCTGDAFYAIQLGCGGSDASVFCHSSLGAGENYPKIDVAGGLTESFTQDIGSSGARNAKWLYFQDLEIKGYNGGPATCSSSGVRSRGAMIGLVGNGDPADKVIHFYIHGNARSNLCQSEHYWAIFTDLEGGEHCTQAHEIKDSYIEQDNILGINDDSDAEPPGNTQSGCSWNIHDNRWRIKDQGNGRVNFAYLKSIDTTGCSADAACTVSGGLPKVFRIYNNEFIWESSYGGGSGFDWFWTIGGFGNGFSNGKGEIWFYGNIVRNRGSGTWSRFNTFNCDAQTSSYRYHNILNTFDFERTTDNATRQMEAICGDAGELVQEKDNAWRKATVVHATTATTTSYGNEICSESSQANCTQNTSGRTGWWTVGTLGVAVHSGLANYIPKSGGPLYEVTANTSCDPDGDGVAGMDYDGDGVNDTSWTDIAGNTVLCTTTTTAISVGAVQPNSDTVTPPPAGMQRRRRIPL